MGAAPDPTELICTSRSNIGPLILQVRKRWEERVWASFIPLLVDKQGKLETWDLIFHCDMDKDYS